MIARARAANRSGRFAMRHGPTSAIILDRTGSAAERCFRAARAYGAIDLVAMEMRRRLCHGRANGSMPNGRAGSRKRPARRDARRESAPGDAARPDFLHRGIAADPGVCRRLALGEPAVPERLAPRASYHAAK